MPSPVKCEQLLPLSACSRDREASNVLSPGSPYLSHFPWLRPLQLELAVLASHYVAPGALAGS